MLKMLRSELDTKRITIWEEFCSIICCERSRTYLDFILTNFSKREEAERERRELERAIQEELMKEAQQEELQKEEKAASFREPRNKNRKEKDNNNGIRSIDKKASS